MIWKQLRHGGPNGESDFLRESPWKEVLDDCIRSTIANVKEAEPFTLEDRMANYDYTQDILRLMGVFSKVCSNPWGDDMQALVLPLRQELEEMELSLEKMTTRLWMQAFEEGLIVPTSEEIAIVSKTYAFKSIYLAGGFFSIIGLRFRSLSMLYELESIYKAPNSTLYSKLRELSVRVWSIVPYLRSLESIVSVSMLNLVFATYVLGDERERDYLLDTILIMDRYLQRLPRDKVELDLVVMEDCKRQGGRILNSEG